MLIGPNPEKETTAPYLFVLLEVSFTSETCVRIFKKNLHAITLVVTESVLHLFTSFPHDAILKIWLKLQAGISRKLVHVMPVTNFTEVVEIYQLKSSWTGRGSVVCVCPEHSQQLCKLVAGSAGWWIKTKQEYTPLGLCSLHCWWGRCLKSWLYPAQGTESGLS